MILLHLTMLMGSDCNAVCVEGLGNMGEYNNHGVAHMKPL